MFVEQPLADTQPEEAAEKQKKIVGDMEAKTLHDAVVDTLG